MAKSVLVVDDMDSQRQLMSNFLVRAGYDVTTAESGAEALEKVKVSKPDIVVTDLVMPEVTGLELCRELKREPATAEIPVIACTTKDRKIDQSWAKKQGVSAYVTKPFTEDQLISAVQSVAA